MNSIEEAIKAAQNSAANISQEANGNMVTTTGGNGGAGLPAQRGPALGLDDLLQGSLNVIAWLKVDKLGMRIGTDNTLFDELDVIIPMAEVGYCKSVRFGNPAQYAKSYDGNTDSRGGSWMETLVRAQRIDQNASEFNTADIPFYLLSDVKNKKGEVLVEAGQAIGHTLAVTGWKPFAAFIKKIQGSGLNVHNGLIQIKLGWTPQKNAKGEWGVLAFNKPEEVAAFPWDVN